MRAAVDALGARLAERRAIALLLCVIAGYLLAHGLGPHPQVFARARVDAAWFIGVAAMALVVAAVARGRACVLALALATVTLSAGWYTARLFERPADSLAFDLHNPGPPGSDADDRGRLLTLRGVVDSPPIADAPPTGPFAEFAPASFTATFRLRVFAVEPDGRAAEPRSGVLTVRVDLHDSGLAALAARAPPGAPVRVTGWARPLRAASNPGQPRWDLLSAQAHRVGTLRVSSPDLITPAPSPDLVLRARAMATALAASLSAPIERWASAGAPGVTDDRAAARALVRAMLLGERSPDLQPISDLFQRQGLLHLVAISGFNLAVMGAVALAVLRLAGDRGWLEPAALAVLIAAYMLVLPADPSILRSGAMVLVYLALEASGRRYDRLNTLALIAVVLLVLRPTDMLSPGFQLSFAVVAGLLTLTPHVSARLFGPPIRGVLREHLPPGRWWFLSGAYARRVRAGLVDIGKAHVAASLTAWLIATPIIAFHTGLFSPLAAVTGLVVLPLAVALLWVGYSAMCVGVLLAVLGVLPGVAGACWDLLDSLAGLFIAAVARLDEAAAAVSVVRVPAVSFVLTLAVVAVVVLWILRGHVRHRASWLATLALAAWLGAEIALAPRLSLRGVRVDDKTHDAALRVDALDVYGGSCRLVRVDGTPDGAVLIDAGSRSTHLGRRVVPGALRAMGVDRVRTIIVTAPTLEHVSLVPDLIEPLGVRRVLIAAGAAHAATGDEARGVRSPASILLAILRERGVEVRVVAPGDRFTLGGGERAAEVLFKGPGSDRDDELRVRVRVDTASGLRESVFTPHAAGAPADRPDVIIVADADRAGDVRDELFDAAVWSVADHGAATMIITPRGDVAITAP